MNLIFYSNSLQYKGDLMKNKLSLSRIQICNQMLNRKSDLDFGLAAMHFAFQGDI